MKPEKLSFLQLFFIMASFELGTAVIFGLGAKAKQDAWLTIVTGMLCGFVLMAIYTKLFEHYPGDTLVQMIPKIVGKWIGYPLAAVYVCYFVYQASRALRDFGDLIVGTLLVGTPGIAVIATFTAVIVYCLRGGLDVFGRVGEILFPAWLAVFGLMWIIVFSSDVSDLQHLKPVLEEGVGGVWKVAFPLVVTFPFGESIVFTMLWPALNDRMKVRKLGMTVILVSGILLTVNTISILAVIGPHLFGSEYFPLFTAVRMASLGDFIEHLDAIVIITMVAGGFFKVGGWLYGAGLGTAQMFKLENYHSILLPLGAITAPLSLMIASNYTEHIDIGLNMDPKYLHVPLQIVIPVILLAVSFVRRIVQSKTLM